LHKTLIENLKTKILKIREQQELEGVENVLNIDFEKQLILMDEFQFGIDPKAEEFVSTAKVADLTNEMSKTMYKMMGLDK
jgi:hypothetical protein